MTPIAAAQFIAVQYGALGQWQSVMVHPDVCAIAYERAAAQLRGELETLNAAKLVLDEHHAAEARLA